MAKVLEGPGMGLAAKMGNFYPELCRGDFKRRV